MQNVTYPEAVLAILAKEIRTQGTRMNYGGGHCTFELNRGDTRMEVEACDTGAGRKVWIDNRHIGTL